MMRRVLILAEGSTEERFTREVLAPYLAGFQVYPQVTLATTRWSKGTRLYRGGVTSYARIRRDIVRLLNDSNASLVTTMLDLYALPNDFPGLKTVPAGSCYDKVLYLEDRLGADLNDRRFLPYLSLHEFEALVFVSPEKIAKAFPGSSKGAELDRISAGFASPEEIDDENPPSKRLLSIFPEYQKVLDGSLIILEIGINEILAKCPHFNSWVRRLTTE